MITGYHFGYIDFNESAASWCIEPVELGQNSLLA